MVKFTKARAARAKAGKADKAKERSKERSKEKEKEKKSAPTPGVHQTLFSPIIRP